MYLSYITYWHSAIYDIVFKFIDFLELLVWSFIKRSGKNGINLVQKYKNKLFSY